MTEVRGQKADERGRKAEDRSQTTKKIQVSAFVSWKSELLGVYRCAWRG